MKIARSIVIAALMSSFLVLGFESEDAAAPPPEDRHLAHATATGSDIWVEATPSGLRDVRPEGGRSSVDDDGDAPTAFNGNDVTEAESSSRERFADQSASDDENVIITSDVDGAVPESGSRTRRPAGARSSVAKSVIRSKSPNKMAPTAESRDQRRPDAQPSRISQLSRREREQLLNNLESSFLKIVGLQSRPRPSGQVTVPQYMRELYQRHRGQPPVHQGTALHNSNTIRSFFDTEDEDKHPENVVRLKFNITSFPGHEVLQAAELRLYREAIVDSRPQRTPPSPEWASSEQEDKNDDDNNNTLGELARQRHRIDVYQILDPGSRSSGTEDDGPVTRLIDTRVVDPARSGWESFDVTPALEAWRAAPNHGLAVRFSRLSGEPSPLRHVRLKRSAEPLRRHGRSRDEPKDKDDWEAHQPLLVTYSQDRARPGKTSHQKERRNKRNTERKNGHRRKRSKKNRGKRRKDRPRKDRDYKRDCRRRALYVDFHDVGWTDWIVAPPGYDAFYCYGECPFHMSDHFNTTNHAVVQQFVHSVDPQAVPKPCCVPTELGQLALLYIDEQGKVVLKNYDEMVVEACGCR